MDQNDFFELFLSNLRKEIENDEFVDSIERLIFSNKLNMDNYLKAIKGE